MRNGFQRFAASITALVCLAAAGYAQQNRIASRIDRAQMVVLRGHTHPKARPEYDRGAVAPSFQLPAVTLHLKLSQTQQAALGQLLTEQQDPASPNYHQWLTPEQYAGRFGVSHDDIGKIEAWLESEGFVVNAVGRGRMWIGFSGTAQQANTAFKTQIHSFDVNGVSYYANATDPSIPAVLANIVSGFHGLNNFHLKPRSVKVMSPEMNSGGGRHNIAPDDLATIYNIAPLYTAGIDGTGQKLAIVGQTGIATSDLRSFRSRFNLPALNLQQVKVPNHPDPGIVDGDLAEADLDIEWSSSVARNATIIYVYSDDVLASLYYAVDQNLAPVVSMSYGSCEGSDIVDLAPMQATAQQANAQGMTWLAAAGDSGAADCEDTGAAVAQDGLAVDAPASIPEVTGMGGTEFNEQGGSYWAPSNDPTTSASALSYIPEIVWNDSAADGALAAGGGGTSIYFARPVWQTGTGVPNDSFRHVPDLSMASSADHDGFYVYTGGASAYYGGTSIAAPSMAGIVVLLNQYLVSSGVQKQPGVGNINPTLYRLAQTTTGVFHDITAGNNGVPCASNSPGCTNGSYGFSAAPGYDLASGLGSPDAYKLIHQWSSQPATASAVVPSIDSNPVFQQQTPVNGKSWTFTLTLTEEAGVGTTLTSFTIDGQPYDVAATFGSGAISPNGSVTSKNLGFATLAAPKTVVFAFAGIDASGLAWSQPFSVPFSGVQTPLVVGGASNAASGQQSYAPGMIVSVYGTALGNFAQSAATIPLPNYLAGFEASVNGVPAPLYYVSPNQVNIQIPYETSPGQATLMVGNPYVNVTYKIQVTAAAPGIFASGGFLAPPFNTARRGIDSTLFITGEGAVRPALATGTSPAPGTPLTRLPKAVLPVTVTVGGETANVAFNGIPSGLVGVTQINFTVPADLAPGVYPVVVTVGTVASPPVNLTVTQ